MKKPEIFFLGAPKCGTTALAQYLSKHPGVQVSNPKETHYFCGDFKTGSRAGSDAEYMGYFGEDALSVRIGVDASVWHMYAPDAIRNILHFQPSARFIVMLRNPVEMAYSYYSMLAFMGWEDQPSLMKAWEKQDERKRGLSIPREFPQSWDKRVLLYKAVCSLGSQLSRVYEQVGEERIHIVFLRDLNKDARAEYRKVLQFLGVPDSDNSPDFSPVNAGRRINLSWLVALQRHASVRRATALLRKSLHIKSFGIGRFYPPASPHEIEFLTDQLQTEIALLERKFQRQI